jgi:hypothetical protein
MGAALLIAAAQKNRPQNLFLSSFWDFVTSRF